MKFLMTRKQLIKELAFSIADTQKRADEWYYERKDQGHSSWLLDQVIPLKDFATRLNICSQVYDEAYKIYDFRNSGRDGYVLKDGKIVKVDE